MPPGVPGSALKPHHSKGHSRITLVAPIRSGTAPGSATTECEEATRFVVRVDGRAISAPPRFLPRPEENSTSNSTAVVRSAERDIESTAGGAPTGRREPLGLNPGYCPVSHRSGCYRHRARSELNGYPSSPHVETDRSTCPSWTDKNDHGIVLCGARGSGSGVAWIRGAGHDLRGHFAQLAVLALRGPHQRRRWRTNLPPEPSEPSSIKSTPSPPERPWRCPAAEPPPAVPPPAETPPPLDSGGIGPVWRSDSRRRARGCHHSVPQRSPIGVTGS